MPEDKESFLASPSPQDMKNSCAKLASSELIEKEATEEVCKIIKERFPSVKMQPDFGTVVSALWDEIKAKCPKGRESMQRSSSH